MNRTLTAGVLSAAAALSLATAVAPDADAVQANAYGPGWTAAIQHRTGPDDDQGRLVMARPTGGIVPIGEVSDGARILDVSTDGRYVMTSFARDGEDRVTVWDTNAKKGSYFRVPENSATLAFTDEGVLEIPSHGSTIRVRDHRGTVTDSYAASALNSGRSYRSAQVSPDGKHLIEATGTLIVRDATTGARVASSPLPEQQTSQRACDLTRAWGTSAVIVQCGDTDGIGNEKVYRVAWNDGTASNLGIVDATPWPVSSGIVHDTDGGQVQPSWVLKTSAGEQKLSFGSTYNDIVGSRGDDVSVLASEEEGGTLLRQHVTTGKQVPLAGTPSTGGGVVTDARTADGNR